MNVVLWVLASALAATFAAAGVLKLFRSRDQLAAQGLTWVEDFSPNVIAVIGVLEVLAAAGLIVPPLVGIAPILAPLAATGLALIMIGAIVTHTRRKEYPIAGIDAVLLVLAAIVAWGRFGPCRF